MDTSTKEGWEIKWDRINTLNNFQFDSNGVRAWEAFEIGEGWHFPHKIQTSEDKLDTRFKIIEDLEQCRQSLVTIGQQIKPRIWVMNCFLALKQIMLRRMIAN